MCFLFLINILLLMICPFICDIECVNKMHKDGITISIVSVGVALIISCYLIIQHLYTFNLPYFQSKIISILIHLSSYIDDGSILWSYFHIVPRNPSMLLVSNYRIQSFAAYFELIRDIYLAFLLFTFFYLMFSYMAYDPETKTASDDRVYETMI